MLNLNWKEIFLPTASAFEVIVRGTVVYFILFILIRLIRKRQAGTVSATDLLVLVIIADASQNAIAGEYKSIGDGTILVATIIFWSFILDWLGYKFPLIGRFVHPRPLILVRNGKIIRENMAIEQLTYEELMSQLREQGLEDVSDVKTAYMEGDGHISVIQKKKERHNPNSTSPL